jgi:hypothetical protein
VDEPSIRGIGDFGKHILGITAGVPLDGMVPDHLASGNQKRSKRDSGAGLAVSSFPRANWLLKTRRETRTVCFVRVCRCVDIRQIDSARSNICFAV